MPPKIPDAAPLTGEEMAVVVQGNKLARTTTQAIANRSAGSAGPTGPKGETGNTGSQGPKGDKGDTGPAGSAGPAGAQGPTGAKGATGSQGVKGDAGTPKRVERFSGTTVSTGIATIAFSPAFDAIPDVDVVPGWTGEQLITGAVIAGTVTKTSCQVQVMLSRATLLLSTGPFQKAAAGVSITVRAIGN